MKQLSVLIFAAAILFCFSSCSKEHEHANSTPQLVFVFKFDSTQQRLNNIGLLDLMPAAQFRTVAFIQYHEFTLC